MLKNDSALERLREVIQRHVAPRRHSALLVAIVATFAARPLIGDWRMAPTIYGIIVVAVLLVGLYTIQIGELVGERGTLFAERREAGRYRMGAGSGGDGGSRIRHLSPSHTLYVFMSVRWLLFISFITWNELRAVLMQREVTGETISMAMSVYLLLGIRGRFFTF